MPGKRNACDSSKVERGREKKDFPIVNTGKQRNLHHPQTNKREQQKKNEGNLKERGEPKR